MSGHLSEHVPLLNQRLSHPGNSFRIIVLTSLSAVFIISCLDIAGWIFSVTILKSIMPGLGTHEAYRGFMFCTISSSVYASLL